jgi:hypothetical protein
MQIPIVLRMKTVVLQILQTLHIMQGVVTLIVRICLNDDGLLTSYTLFFAI